MRTTHSTILFAILCGAFSCHSTSHNGGQSTGGSCGEATAPPGPTPGDVPGSTPGSSGKAGSSNGGYSSGDTPEKPIPYVPFDINHVLSTGQSSSVSHGGVPVLTTTQPYDNIMSPGGGSTSSSSSSRR